MKELSDQQRSLHSGRKRVIALNTLIGLLAVVVISLSYWLLDRHVFHPPVETQRSDDATGQIIQIDILNGCGESGLASKFAAFLRARGYDVVEMRNYKTFDVHTSMVIDRSGNLENAEKVAYALGIGRGNIIQQMNPDYYVDVSIVIGKDHASLRPSH